MGKLQRRGRTRRRFRRIRPEDKFLNILLLVIALALIVLGVSRLGSEDRADSTEVLAKHVEQPATTTSKPHRTTSTTMATSTATAARDRDRADDEGAYDHDHEAQGPAPSGDVVDDRPAPVRDAEHRVELLRGRAAGPGDARRAAAHSSDDDDHPGSGDDYHHDPPATAAADDHDDESGPAATHDPDPTAALSS